jgi:hypothetical protein
VYLPDCEGVTTIDTAARQGHWDAAEDFPEHDPIIRPEGVEYPRKQLYEASESGDLEVVRIILKCGISVGNINNYSYTTMHIAVKSAFC